MSETLLVLAQSAQIVVLRHDAATPFSTGLVQAIITTFQQEYQKFKNVVKALLSDHGSTKVLCELHV